MRRLHGVAATQLPDVYGSCGVYDNDTCQLVVLDQRRQVLIFTPMDDCVGTEADAGAAGDGGMAGAHSRQRLQQRQATEEVHVPEAGLVQGQQVQQEEAGGGAGAGAGLGGAQGHQAGPAGAGGGPAPGPDAGQQEQQDQKTQYDLQVGHAQNSKQKLRTCRVDVWGLPLDVHGTMDVRKRLML